MMGGCVMGLIDRAKGLDNKILGSSNSTRGFVFNAASGLHPKLAPVWFAAAVAGLVVAVVALIKDPPMPGLFILIVSAACAFMGYVCSGMPQVPRR
jgi:Flp pilus assembly protein TadB